MSQPIRSLFSSWTKSVRAGLGQRAAALGLTLLLEGLLALLLLSLAPTILPDEEAEIAVFSLAPTPVAEEPAAPPEPEAREDPASKQLPQPEQAPIPPPPAEPPPAPPAPPWLELSRQQMAAAEIGATSPHPAPPAVTRQSVIGPPGTSTSGDTQRVAGQGPHGEPLYAASWYREPYDEELRGYLSTAQGPGWGLIACRTVADYRVADCVAVDEYPQGSNITRAILAAAWQFRVRPPRIGGELKVGEWVRIRIDYEQRRP